MNQLTNKIEDFLNFKTNSSLLKKWGDIISQFFEDAKQGLLEAIAMDNECNTMIKATRHNNTTTEQLLDVLETKGVIGVYNLGMSDLFQYLSSKEKK